MSAARTSLLAAERVRLYLTLVPYLLERRQVPLAEAAVDFGVSEKVLRTMVERLTVIGLPGDDALWQPPQDLFDINWDLLDAEGTIEITNDVGLRRVPRFTAREAAALLAGLQMVASLPAITDSGIVRGLLAKLARGASAAPLEVVVTPPVLDEVRTVVARALGDGVAVSFTYQAPDAEATVRTVDPVRVLTADASWYLQGWCHLRRAMRTFRLDRISDPALTDQPVTHRDEGVPAIFAGESDDDPAEIRMPVAIAALVSDFLASADSVDGDLADGPADVVARLRMADPRGLKRLAGRFGGRLEVSEPETARSATREWAAAGLALYRHP